MPAASAGRLRVKRVRSCGGALEGDAAAVALDDRLHEPQAEPEAGGFRLRAAAAPEAREQRRTVTGGGPRDPRPPPTPAPRAPRASAPMRTTLPSGANLLALASRLTNTWVSRGLSPAHQPADPAAASPRGSGAAAPGAMPTSARASSTTSASATLWWRMASCPDSMRTLSSRLSISCVRRSVPRSSELTSSRWLRRRHVLQAVEQQLDGGELRGERRAELVRDVGEHRVARAAHRFELGLVADHLHLQALDRCGAGDHRGARRRRRAPPGARPPWRCRRCAPARSGSGNRTAGGRPRRAAAARRRRSGRPPARR